MIFVKIFGGEHFSVFENSVFEPDYYVWFKVGPVVLKVIIQGLLEKHEFK